MLTAMIKLYIYIKQAEAHTYKEILSLHANAVELGKLTFLAVGLCIACCMGFRVEVVWPVFCMSNAG